MKRFRLFLCSVFLLSACGPESESPAIAPGTYHLELFDIHGKKILERDGAAIGLGSYSQVILEDPLFITNGNEDPLNTFASIIITTGDEDHVWDEQKLWSLRGTSRLNQRYYSMLNDWSYSSTSGELMIESSSPKLLKGRFNMTMEVSPNEDNFITWTTNPQWGDRIVLKGYFSSRGWQNKTDVVVRSNFHFTPSQKSRSYTSNRNYVPTILGFQGMINPSAAKGAMNQTRSNPFVITASTHAGFNFIAFFIAIYMGISH